MKQACAEIPTHFLLAVLEQLHLHSARSLLTGTLHHSGTSLGHLQRLLQCAALELQLLLVTFGTVGSALHGQDHLLRDLELVLEFPHAGLREIQLYLQLLDLFFQDSCEGVRVIYQVRGEGGREGGREVRKGRGEVGR